MPKPLPSGLTDAINDIVRRIPSVTVRKAQALLRHEYDIRVAIGTVFSALKQLPPGTWLGGKKGRASKPPSLDRCAIEFAKRIKEVRESIRLAAIKQGKPVHRTTYHLFISSDGLAQRFQGEKGRFRCPLGVELDVYRGSGIYAYRTPVDPSYSREVANEYRRLLSDAFFTHPDDNHLFIVGANETIRRDINAARGRRRQFRVRSLSELDRELNGSKRLRLAAKNWLRQALARLDCEPMSPNSPADFHDTYILAKLQEYFEDVQVRSKPTPRPWPKKV